MNAMKYPIFAILAAALAAAPAGARALGSLEFTPCDLPGEASARSIRAECASLEVPENPDAPEGRRIRLRIGLVPSRAPDPKPDPVFFLAGGPGQGALEAYPGIAAGFARINEKRHIILVDQRGTGGSNRLACPLPEGALPETLDLESQKAFVRDCLAGLEGDPRFYTTTDAVRDLEAVRRAIGAGTVNVVGGSYGTRVAQIWLRRHESAIRSVILDGVVPGDLILGSEHAKSLESALESIFERCRANERCREAFGSPREDLDRLRARVARAPLRVDLTDPKSGRPTTATLTSDLIMIVVRIFAYQPETAALLPMMLHEAAAGRPQALVAQGMLILGDLGEQIAHGMQLSVMCAEDAPFLRPDPADQGSLLGSAFVEAILAQCGIWPRGALPDDFHAPLESDRPVLILSGELDPVTPPSYGDRVLEGLGRARHLIAPNQGHIVLNRGCMPRLAAEFIEGLDPAALDASCLDALPPVPAFVTHNGWGP